MSLLDHNKQLAQRCSRTELCRYSSQCLVRVLWQTWSSVFYLF